MEFNTARSWASEKVGQTADLTLETLYLHGIIHMSVHVGGHSDQQDHFRRIYQNGEFNLAGVWCYFNFGSFDSTTARVYLNHWTGCEVLMLYLNLFYNLWTI